MHAYTPHSLNDDCLLIYFEYWNNWNLGFQRTGTITIDMQFIITATNLLKGHLSMSGTQPDIH